MDNIIFQSKISPHLAINTKPTITRYHLTQNQNTQNQPTNTMSGIINKIGDALHMGGGHKEDEHKDMGGGHKEVEHKMDKQVTYSLMKHHSVGIVDEIKDENKDTLHMGGGHKDDEHKDMGGGHKDDEYKTDLQKMHTEKHGHSDDKIEDKIHGEGGHDDQKEHGHDGEKKKKKEKKKKEHGHGHEGHSSSDSDSD